MNRHMSLFVAALLTVAVIGMIPVAAAVAGDVTTDVGEVGEVAIGQTGDEMGDEENETGSDLKPGERFSGVVGVQQAELEGDIDARAFGVRLAEADTDDERAAVIAEQLDRNEQRLEAISDRQDELRDRRAAGEMSEGAYAARTAQTGAQVESVKLTTERSAEVADSLPDHVREESGIRTDRIDALRDRASSLSGPEVAEMAREIGGNQTGAPMGPPRGDGPGTGIGPPGGDDGPSGSDNGPSGNDDGPPGNDDGPPGNDDEPSGSDDGPSGSDDGPPGNGDNRQNNAAVGTVSVERS